MDLQRPAHGPDAERLTLCPDEGVLLWGPRATYTVAFSWMSRPCVTLARSRFDRRFSAAWSMTIALDAGSTNSITHLYGKCVPKPNRPDRTLPHADPMLRIPLERTAAIACPNSVSLPQNLGAWHLEFGGGGSSILQTHPKLHVQFSSGLISKGRPPPMAL